MNNFFNFLIFAILLCTCNPVTSAQLVSIAPSNKNSAKKVYQEPSLKDVLASGEKFLSLDGRYAIALPKRPDGFAGLTPKEMGIDATTSTFKWNVREGSIRIDVINISVEALKETQLDYDRLFASGREDIVVTFKSTVLNESKIEIDGGRGMRFDFKMPNGTKGTRHYFIINNRIYTLYAYYDSNVKDAETLISQSFDTFKPLSQADVADEISRRIKAANPKPLPQTPSTPKAKSDAEDENLKGKVKLIEEESEDFSPDAVEFGRNLTSTTEYDERGMRTRVVSYDKSIAVNITVYGWIDEMRVEEDAYIENESEPLNSFVTLNPTAKKYDSRYSHRYEYKYANGKLLEVRDIMSNGGQWDRIIYTYNGNQKTETIYDDKNKLIQKNLYLLDPNGNVTQETSVVISKGDQNEQSAYNYTEFDAQGNWIKRSTIKPIIKDGKNILESQAITYRKISYY